MITKSFCLFHWFTFLSFVMDSDELILVDLAILSKTKFADAIIDADFLESDL